MWSLIGLSLAVIGGIQTNGRTDQVTLARLDRLVSIYKKLDLPFPPANAPLVKTSETNYEFNGTKGTSFNCDYLLAANAGGRPTMFTRNPVDEATELTHPDHLVQLNKHAARSVMLWREGFNGDYLLQFAIIERTRQHNEFALELLRREEEESRPIIGVTLGGNRTLLLVPTRNDDLENKLPYLALNFWLDRLVRPDSDRGYVLQRLSRLVTQHRELSNAYVAGLISGLRSTLLKRYRGPNSIERLIDSLCDSEEDGTRLEGNAPSEVAKVKPLLNLLSLGYQVVPYLLKHAGDKRLTRSFCSDVMSGPARFITVGEVCLNLADQYSTVHSDYGDLRTRKRAIEQWWRSASKLSERRNCLARLMVPGESIPDAPIRWAERHSPDLLVQVYDGILTKDRNTQTYPFLEAMERSSLKRQVVIAAAERGSRSRSLDQIHSAIWTLSRLDPSKFNFALLAVLRRLPASSTGVPWPSREASFAQQVGQSDSPSVWKALGDAAQRADVDLRLELIDQASDHKKSGRKKFLKYLLRFFDDTSSAPKKKSNTQGPPSEAHFQLRSERVQDLAASLAGSELGMPNIPQASASGAAWNAFRAQAKRKLTQALGTG